MIYVFDDYELDTHVYELRHARESLKLEPKVFDVLTYLVQHRDHVVSKDELIGKLWPEQFIGDAALVRCIVAARKAVGDDANVQRYIKTLRGRGYRFVAVVEERGTAGSDTPLPAVGRADAPVVAPAVLEVPSVLPRAEPPLTGPASAFVGRAQELATLYELLAQAESGQGQVVGLIGPPGIGKSRLLREFRRSLHGRQVTYLEACCRAMHSALPSFPIRDLLRQYCGFTTADSPAVVTVRVHEHLQALGVDPGAGLLPLLHVLGVEADGRHLDACSLEVLHAHTLAAVRQVFEQGSRQRPLVIALEDLPQIDAVSGECIAVLAESLAAAPILLLATFPAEDEPAWMAVPYATRVVLPPLTARDSLRVIHALIPPGTVSNDLAQALCTKAAGNPLGLEQVTQALREHSLPAGEVPDSLQDVLATRLQQLPAEHRRLLQTAAVFGQQVPQRLLEAGGGRPADIAVSLRVLEQHGWGHVQTAAEEPTWVFAHATLQEVAYHSVSLAERQSSHDAALHVLEAHDATLQDTGTARLAYHATQAARADAAVALLTRVAEDAERRGAPAEAVTALHEALAHVPGLPVTPERERVHLALCLRLAQALPGLGRTHEALDVLQSHGERPLQEASLAAPWALLRSRIHSQLGQWTCAAADARRAVEAATQHGDEPTKGQALHVLAMERYWSESPLQGIAWGSQAVAALTQTTAHSQVGLAHFVLGLHHWLYGNFALALEATAQAQTVGDALRDGPLQTCAAWATGVIEATRGAWDAGVLACQQALASGCDPLNTAFAWGSLGYAYLEQGNVAEALPCLERAAQQMQHFQYARFQGWYTTLRGEAMLRDTYLEKAQELALQGLTVARETRHRFGTGWAQRTLGRIASARGNLSAAVSHLHEALTAFNTIPVRFEVGRTHLALLEITQRQGQHAAAAGHLAEAYAVFSALQVEAYITRTTQQAQELGVPLAALS